jgi:hypothetical protein
LAVSRFVQQRRRRPIAELPSPSEPFTKSISSIPRKRSFICVGYSRWNKCNQKLLGLWLDIVLQWMYPLISSFGVLKVSLLTRQAAYVPRRTLLKTFVLLALL